MSNKVRFSSEIEQVGFTRPSSLVLFDTRISDAAFRLYNILSWYARNAGYCFPGIDKICARIGKKGRSIRGILSELKKSGLISIEYRNGKSSVYIIESIGDRYCSDSNLLSDDTLVSCNLKRVFDKESNSHRIVSDYPDSSEKVEEEVKDSGNNSRRKSILNIKSAADAASENWKNKVKKNREKEMIVPSKKMDNEEEKSLTKELNTLWFNLWIEKFGDMPFTKWAAKERTIVKYLLKKHNYSDLKKLVEYVFNNWGDLRLRFKLSKSHAPTLGILSSMSDIWIQEIYRGKPNLKKEIIDQDEYEENHNYPTVGWGDEEDSIN